MDIELYNEMKKAGFIDPPEEKIKRGNDHKPSTLKKRKVDKLARKQRKRRKR